ncbi:MAG: aspartate aminotransferase family protein [Alphaproteobacteria bacterium]|nr:aspartate aminotransferase family protein [Alphaproteobacteria bacterium]
MVHASPARGNSLAARDIASVLHPYTNLKKHESAGPMMISEGRGVYVTDDAGKTYIEGMAGLWCTSLGFNEERLVAAAVKQMRRLPYYHAFNHKSYDVAVDLAERLIELAPVPMSKAFFANSGSEANDTVVKFVWYYNNALGRPKKKKIISRIKGYHGVTVASASLTGLPNNHRDFDLPIANILHTSCPHYYRFGNPGESEADFVSRCAADLEALIQKEGADTIAAFIAEPIMGAGGVIVPPSGYFEKIQPILKKHDILLIADEVICGFGRTGNMWGSETLSIKPDIMTMAKALSSAYLPISAVLIGQRVYEALRENSDKIGVFGHGYTYTAHPVAAAVAVETLKIYAEREIVGHVRKVGPRLQAGLRKLADHPLVGEVRGLGLFGAIELVADKKTKASFDPKQAVGPFMAKRCEEHGLIVRAMGGDSIAVCPPLIITEDEIDLLLQRYTKALEDTAAHVKQQGLAKVA